MPKINLKDELKKKSKLMLPVWKNEKGKEVKGQFQRYISLSALRRLCEKQEWHGRIFTSCSFGNDLHKGLVELEKELQEKEHD